MIGLVLLAASAAAPAPPTQQIDPQLLNNAAHAIEVGRLDQARLMIGQAVGARFSGPRVDRLLADLAFASGKYDEALVRYRALATAHRDQQLCTNAAIAALHLESADEARPFADCATGYDNPRWQAWNIRGVVADLDKDWPAADQAYSRASAIAPDEPQILNNEGWSLLLRGDWANALSKFESAAKLMPQSSRIENNLELARSALASDLPAREPGESGSNWAARLNDAGVAAELLGDDKRALAAFTQALQASSTWYARASNNLEALGKQ